MSLKVRDQQSFYLSPLQLIFPLGFLIEYTNSNFPFVLLAKDSVDLNLFHMTHLFFGM